MLLVKQGAKDNAVAESSTSSGWEHSGNSTSDSFSNLPHTAIYIKIVKFIKYNNIQVIKYLHLQVRIKNNFLYIKKCTLLSHWPLQQTKPVTKGCDLMPSSIYGTGCCEIFSRFRDSAIKKKGALMGMIWVFIYKRITNGHTMLKTMTN